MVVACISVTLHNIHYTKLLYGISRVLIASHLVDVANILFGSEL